MRKWSVMFGIFLLLASTLSVVEGEYTAISSSMSSCGDGWERGENIALDKPVRGYNLVDGYDNPAYANDGIKDDETKVVSIGKCPSPEGWIEIDLQNPYYIYETRIIVKRIWVPLDKKQSDMKLQLFIKGHWITVWSENNMPNGIKQEIVIPCSGYKTDKVRIVKSKSTGLLEDILTIYEIEVYDAIDISPPDTEIIGGPRNGVTIDYRNVKFKWRGIDNELEEDLSYEWRVKNQGTWSEWTKTRDKEVVLHLKEGKTVFEVRSIDSFGNVDPSPARVRFYVDLSSPEVNITMPEAGYLYVFGIKVLPVVVNGSYAVVIGSCKLKAFARDAGGGLSHGEIYLNEVHIKHIDFHCEKEVDIENDVYNGFFRYRIVVFDTSEKSAYDSIQIKGYSTGRDPPGYLSNRNAPPYQVTKPLGPSAGKTDKIYTFSCKAEDVEKDEIYYMFVWGDGTNSGWIGPFRAGETAEASHSWSKKGTYEIKVFVKDDKGNQGEWYSSTTIKINDRKDNNRQDNNVVHNKRNVFVIKRFKPSPIKIFTGETGIKAIVRNSKILNETMIFTRISKTRITKSFNLGKIGH